jgi:HPt (histidine-containing phosphotransfer) domain-containing protein
MNQTNEERVAAARARLAELKHKFVERSQAEVQTMRGSFSTLQSGEVAALQVLVQLAHRMSGTGATLGLEALSDCAQRIEKLAEVPPPGSLPDADLLSRLGAAIEVLAAELARTPRDG